MSFFLSEYQALLDIAQQGERVLCGVLSYVEALPDERARSLMILRHDVDRLVDRAVAMAELERAAGVRSTFYFRCSREGRFPAKQIELIARLGHETGYHYECLSATKGDRAAALAAFERNLSNLRRIAPCRTVAMHGAPLSRHHNQDLLIGRDLSEFDLKADASLSFAAVELAYFTDTGGRWNASIADNFRDRVGQGGGEWPSPSSREFPAWLRHYENLVYVSTHPERWNSSWGRYVVALSKDLAISRAKRAIKLVRGFPT
jgi:hypothetical protein